MTEYIFQDVTNSDGNAGQSWVVTVDDNGKIVSQIPPNLKIPDDAVMFTKNGGDKTPLNMNYGQFRSQPQNMEMTSADGTPVGDYEGEPDYNSMLDANQQAEAAEQGVNGAQNASYGPNGIYDPAKPIKIDVAGTLTMGAEGRPISVNSTKEIPQGELTALGIYGSPGVNIENLAREAAMAVSSNDRVTMEQVNGVYKNAVRYAAAKGVTVQSALRDMITMGGLGPGRGSGGVGSNGPFSTTTTTINETDELEAERILNSALSTYLGRRADSDEVAKFVEVLNKNEKFNPTVTKTTGVRSGHTTTQQSTQTGGFDSTEFAERWARSREGAGEYAAATTYMDAFQSVIDGMEY